MAEAVIIQGKIAGSINEVYVARAMDEQKIPYYYQYPINGGRSKGGLVVDFVALIPWAQPVEVQGGIWHKGRMGLYDQFALMVEEQVFGRKPIELFEEDSNSQEAARRAVRQKIGRVF